MTRLVLGKSGEMIGVLSLDSRSEWAGILDWAHGPHEAVPTHTPELALRSCWLLDSASVLLASLAFTVRCGEGGIRRGLPRLLPLALTVTLSAVGPHIILAEPISGSSPAPRYNFCPKQS